MVNKKSVFRRVVLASAAVVAAGFLSSPSAKGNIVITPTFDSTITSDPNASAIEAAINATIARVQAVVTTNTTSTITFSEMSTGLGQSSTSHYSVPYSTYYSAIKTQQTLSTNDNTAIASLPTNTTVNPVNNNANIYVQTTLARARILLISAALMVP